MFGENKFCPPKPKKRTTWNEEFKEHNETTIHKNRILGSLLLLCTSMGNFVALCICYVIFKMEIGVSVHFLSFQ